jgi:hypothetical protein
MTLIPFPRVVRTEAIGDHVEVVHGELVVEDIPVLLRGRRAALLAASGVHVGSIGGNGGRGCVCAAAAGLHSPVSSLRWAVSPRQWAQMAESVARASIFGRSGGVEATVRWWQVRCGAVCSALAEDVVVVLQRVERRVAGWLWAGAIGRSRHRGASKHSWSTLIQTNCQKSLQIYMHF